eukprot:gene6896-9448_t
MSYVHQLIASEGQALELQRTKTNMRTKSNPSAILQLLLTLRNLVKATFNEINDNKTRNSMLRSKYEVMVSRKLIIIDALRNWKSYPLDGITIMISAIMNTLKSALDMKACLLHSISNDTNGNIDQKMRPKTGHNQGHNHELNNNNNQAHENKLLHKAASTKTLSNANSSANNHENDDDLSSKNKSFFYNPNGWYLGDDYSLEHIASDLVLWTKVFIQSFNYSHFDYKNDHMIFCIFGKYNYFNNNNNNENNKSDYSSHITHHNSFDSLITAIQSCTFTGGPILTQLLSCNHLILSELTSNKHKHNKIMDEKVELWSKSYKESHDIPSNFGTILYELMTTSNELGLLCMQNEVNLIENDYKEYLNLLYHKVNGMSRDNNNNNNNKGASIPSKILKKQISFSDINYHSNDGNSNHSSINYKKFDFKYSLSITHQGLLLTRLLLHHTFQYRRSFSEQIEDFCVNPFIWHFQPLLDEEYHLKQMKSIEKDDNIDKIEQEKVDNYHIGTASSGDNSVGGLGEGEIPVDSTDNIIIASNAISISNDDNNNNNSNSNSNGNKHIAENNSLGLKYLNEWKEKHLSHILTQSSVFNIDNYDISFLDVMHHIGESFIQSDELMEQLLLLICQMCYHSNMCISLLMECDIHRIAHRIEESRQNNVYLRALCELCYEQFADH